MSIIVAVVERKKYGFEIRSYWELSPNCDDKAGCTYRFEVCAKK